MKHWSNTGPALVKHWSSTGQSLDPHAAGQARGVVGLPLRERVAAVALLYSGASASV